MLHWGPRGTCRRAGALCRVPHSSCIFPPIPAWIAHLVPGRILAAPCRLLFHSGRLSRFALLPVFGRDRPMETATSSLGLGSSQLSFGPFLLDCPLRFCPRPAPAIHVDEEYAHEPGLMSFERGARQILVVSGQRHILRNLGMEKRIGDVLPLSSPS